MANSVYRGVLNVSLYNALCRFFGEGEENVRIAAEGEEIDWVLRRNILETSKRRMRREVLNSGEEYVVRCPFCKDHRQRLWINHLWGHMDPDTGQRNLWLAQCWNEQCLSEYENQKKLFQWIYVQGGASEESRIRPGKKTSSKKLCEVAPAGTLIRLVDLEKNDPHHYALEYLRERYFDPAYLDRTYGVRYCLDSRYTHAQDRIYIPVKYGGKLVGWQTRYIGDDVQGRPFNEMGVPKYFTCPGMARRHVTYNLERALQHPTLVMVEGPLDVWNFGPMATGLLSTKISRRLLRKIVRTLARRFGDEAAIVLMLDPEWDEQALKKKKHPMDVIAERLDECQFGNVVTVWLPEGSDPGSLDRAITRGMAKEEGAKLGIPVTFARPPCKT